MLTPLEHDAPGPRRPLRVVHLTAIPEMLLFLQGHLADLAGRGFEVVVVSSPGPLLDELAQSEGVARVGVPISREITPARDAVSLVRLLRVFRALRPDVVDVHTVKAGLLGMIAARLAGVPVRVYHLHGLRHATTSGLRRAILRAGELVTSHLATRVLCVSRSVAREALADGLLPPRRTAVLLGGSIAGVDATGRFTPARDEGERRAARAAIGLPAGARVLGFVGRIVRDKGVVELAAAWGALRERHPDLRLVLVGVREPGDPVPDDVFSALAGDPRVLLAGQVRDTPRWYRAMDVLALPTYREGFPVVTLEAAAMALPVVATRIPGCVDAIVDGETGTLVQPRDVAALGAAIGAYLDDPALRARHGGAARARVLRDFDQQAMWKALREEYERLAREARAGDRPTARPALERVG